MAFAMGGSSLGTLWVHLRADTLNYQRNMGLAVKTMTKTVRLAQSVNASLIRHGRRLAIISAGIGVASLKAFADFESGFIGVQKTVDGTTQELERLKQGFVDMSKSIPLSISGLFEIGEAAGQLGIKTENILAFSKTMAQLGVTTNLSAQDAATSLARLANITGMSQDSFDKLGATIVDLGNNFATTEAEIVEMGLRLAGAGKLIGLSEASILSLATALSSVGIRAEAGGTAVSRIMLEMNSAVISGTKELRVFAEIAGTTIQDFARVFRDDAQEAINLFVAGLGRIRNEGGDLTEVFSRLGLNNVRILDTFNRLSGASDLVTRAFILGNRAWKENTALVEEAEKKFKSFGSQMTLLWNRIKDIARIIGQDLSPLLVDLGLWFKNNETTVKNWALNLSTHFRLAVSIVKQLIKVFQTDFAKGMDVLFDLSITLFKAIGIAIIDIGFKTGQGFLKGIIKGLRGPDEAEVKRLAEKTFVDVFGGSFTTKENPFIDLGGGGIPETIRVASNPELLRSLTENARKKLQADLGKDFGEEVMSGFGDGLKSGFTKALVDFRSVLEENDLIAEPTRRFWENEGVRIIQEWGNAGNALVTLSGDFNIAAEAAEDFNKTVADTGKVIKPVSQAMMKFKAVLVEWAGEAAEVWTNVGQVVTNAFDNMARSFARMLTDSKANFKGFVKAILEDLITVIIRARIAQAALALAGMNFGGSVGQTASVGGGASFSNTEGIVESQNIPKLANGGIVSGPTLAMVGEAGPEAILPLDTLAGLGKPPNVIVKNMTGIPMNRGGPPQKSGEDWVVEIVTKNWNEDGIIKQTIRTSDNG